MASKDCSLTFQTQSYKNNLERVPKQNFTTYLANSKRPTSNSHYFDGGLFFSKQQEKGEMT
jgi:hypothetical protein